MRVTNNLTVGNWIHQVICFIGTVTISLMVGYKHVEKLSFVHVLLMLL